VRLLETGVLLVCLAGCGEATDATVPARPPHSEQARAARVSSPLVVDPLAVSSEIVLSVPDGLDELRRAAPALAVNGNATFVVWAKRPRADESAPFALRGFGRSLPTSAPGIDTFVGAVDVQTPAVVFDGQSYVVVWHERSAGSGDVRGARVVANAGAYEISGFEVATSSSAELGPAIACSGIGCLVVHQAGDPDGAVRASMLDDTGAVQPLTEDLAASGSAPSVAFRSGAYLIAWREAGRIAGLRLDAEAEPKMTAFRSGSCFRIHSIAARRSNVGALAVDALNQRHHSAVLVVRHDARVTAEEWIDRELASRRLHANSSLTAIVTSPNADGLSVAPRSTRKCVAYRPSTASRYASIARPATSTIQYSPTPEAA
jgi:hypothetical protein